LGTIIIDVMTPQNFANTLQAFQRRTPFHPYSVELVSGDRLQVDHPEALVTRAGVAAFFDKRGAPTLFDHESVSQFISNGRKKRA
jgi:hypothetical protein